jgi:hypothetical protein
VLQTTGSFYQKEVHDGGLGWIQTYARDGAWPVAVQFFRNAQLLTLKSVPQFLPYVPFLVLPLLAVVTQSSRVGKHEWMVVRLSSYAALLTAALFLIFFSLLGFGSWRYAAPLPPAWALTTALLNGFAYAGLRSGRVRATYTTLQVFIGATLVLFVVLKDGPWS